MPTNAARSAHNTVSRRSNDSRVYSSPKPKPFCAHNFAQLPEHQTQTSVNNNMNCCGRRAGAASGSCDGPFPIEEQPVGRRALKRKYRNPVFVVVLCELESLAVGIDRGAIANHGIVHALISHASGNLSRTRRQRSWSVSTGDLLKSIHYRQFSIIIDLVVTERCQIHWLLPDTIRSGHLAASMPLINSHPASAIIAANIGMSRKSESCCGESTTSRFFVTKPVPASINKIPSQAGRYADRYTR